MSATPERFDVVIVGAGPSGTSTAMHLLAARPETRIAIVERHLLPREKPCGGAVSRWGLAVLDRLDAGLDRLGVDHVPIGAIRVRYRDTIGEHVIPRDQPPLGAVVRRDRFDHALAREAVARGVTLIEGHRVVALSKAGREFSLELEAERGGARRVVEGRLVIGADGTGSAVRRLSGLAEEGPRARLVVLETEEVPRDDVLRKDCGVIEFDLTSIDHGIDGYVWHFATPSPSGEGGPAVSRGIYDWRGKRQGDAIALRGTLEKMLIARGVDPKRVRFKPYTERVFTAGEGPLSRKDGVLLVGEAAGLVDPVTGEGIAQALASGAVGARSAAEHLDNHGRVDPAAHDRGIRALPCASHLRQALALAPHVYGKHATAWCAALAACPAAIDAGVDWYVGEKLGLWRKASVGAALAYRAAVSVTTGGVRASRE